MIRVTRPHLNCERNIPVISDELTIAVIGQTKKSMHCFTSTVGNGSKLQDFVHDGIMTDLTS